MINLPKMTGRYPFACVHCTCGYSKARCEQGGRKGGRHPVTLRVARGPPPPPRGSSDSLSLSSAPPPPHSERGEREASVRFVYGGREESAGCVCVCVGGGASASQICIALETHLLQRAGERCVCVWGGFGG